VGQPDLRSVGTAARRAAKLAERAEEAMRERDELIVEAIRSGATTRQIAEAAEISAVQVSRIGRRVLPARPRRERVQVTPSG
jgi:DNA-directed RNA polymerase specialized sigma subunit